MVRRVKVEDPSLNNRKGKLGTILKPKVYRNPPDSGLYLFTILLSTGNGVSVVLQTPLLLVPTQSVRPPVKFIVLGRKRV